MILNDLLRSGILSILLSIVVVSGWLWNVLIVVVMIRNEFPVDRKIQVISMVPYGLSLYFVGVGLGLAILWYRDFRDGRYPDDGPTWFPNHDLLERLEEL